MARFKDFLTASAPNSHTSSEGVFTVKAILAESYSKQARNFTMKTKTTITVETYKFSTLSLKRERAATICASCGGKITANDHVADCDRPNEIARRTDTKKINSYNGEKNEERKFNS